MGGSLGEAVLDLRAPVGPLERDLRQAERTSHGILGSIQRSLTRIFEFATGTLLANAIQRIGAGIRQIGASAMEAVGRAQVLEKSLQGLLTEQLMYTRNADGVYQQTLSFGEASQIAASQVGDLLRFVERLSIASPFETTQVEEVIRLGIAADLSAKKVKAFTAAFLDYAAVHGITSANLSFAADQFLQLKKAGTLTAIDLRQLRRLGIDVAKILGSQLGMSVEQFNEAVKQSPELMDSLFDAFVQMSTGGAAGAAADMAGTVDGQMATMRDVVEMGSRNLFRPIIEAITPISRGIVGRLSEIATSEELKALGQRIGDTLALAIQGGEALLGGDYTIAIARFGQAVETAFGPEAVSGFYNVVNAIKDIAAGVGLLREGDASGAIAEFGEAVGRIFGPDAQTAFVNVAGVIQDLAATLQSLSAYFRIVREDGDYLNDWLTNMPGPIARLAEVIGFVISRIQEGAGFFEILKDLLTGYGGEAGGGVVAFFENLVAKLTEFGQAALPYVLTGLHVLISVVIAFVQTVGPAFQSLWDSIVQLATTIGTHLEAMGVTWQGVGNTIGAVLAFIGGAVVLAIGLIAGVINGIAAGIAQLAEWIDVMATHVQTAFEQIRSWLSAAGRFFKAIFEGDFGGAIEALKEAWSSWWGLVGTIITAFLDMISGALLTATSTIEGFIDGVFGFLNNLFDTISTFDLSKAAHDLIQGLINGMDAKFQEALDTVRGWGDKIAQGIRDVLGIHSPSTVGFDVGWQLGEGVERGAVARFKALLGQGSEMLRVLAQTPDALSTATAGASQALAPVTVNVNANVTSDVDIDRLARRIAGEIQRRQR